MFRPHGRKNKKHDFAERLMAVEKVLRDHISVRNSARQIGADHMQVKYWIAMYERYGKEGLRMRHNSYSGDFKAKVMEDMYGNQLNLYDTALKYGIPSPSTVLSWKKIYDLSGSAGLYKDSKEWKETMTKVKSKPISSEIRKRADPQTKALLKELEYLKAENAYLKKLQALVQQRISRGKGKELPPSKN